MAQAKAPSRGDKITLQFGLVNVPVTIFNAIDGDGGKISRSLRVNDGHPVKYAKVDGETGEVVAESDIYKVFAVEDGTEVPLSDEEIAAATGTENGSCTVKGTYPVAQIDKYLVSGNAQVRPQTAKVGSKTTRPFDKPFALFMKVLEQTDKFVLIEYVTRGTPKLGAVFGDGSMRLLHFEQEVREQAKWPEVEVSEQEVAMATKLLSMLSEDEAPVVENTAVEAVRTYAQLKAIGSAPEVSEDTVAATTSDDLMAQLMASMQGANA